MEKQVKVVNEETFDEALELIAENPVNISSPIRSWFNITNAEQAMGIVGDLAAHGTPVTVEVVAPKSRAIFSHGPTHHIHSRELQCPSCKIKASEFGGVLRRNRDEHGTTKVTCGKCGWIGSEMSV